MMTDTKKIREFGWLEAKQSGGRARKIGREDHTLA